MGTQQSFQLLHASAKPFHFALHLHKNMFGEVQNAWIRLIPM
jgi:hypothetical protein